MSDRSFHICKDHVSADWNQPTLEDDGCILCRLFYLEAQEGLLEEWQQRAQRAEDAITEIKRPLDEQMARLNATVTKLNEENARLREALESAVGIIKQWHNMGIQDGSPLDVWQIYYDNAPEMKPLRAAVAPQS